MIRRPPRSTLSSSSAASDVYKRDVEALTVVAFARALPMFFVFVMESSFTRYTVYTVYTDLDTLATQMPRAPSISTAGEVGSVSASRETSMYEHHVQPHYAPS